MQYTVKLNIARTYRQEKKKKILKYISKYIKVTSSTS